MPAALPILIGLTVASTIDSRNRAIRTERANKRLQEVSQAEDRDKAARERRNQIRQQNSAMAQIQNTAAVAGQQGSSAPIATAAGVQAQVSSNIGQINDAISFGGVKSELQQDIFNLQQPSDLQYAAGIANSIFEAPKIKVK